MTIIYFIIVLGVTVFIHELGHFIFAKKAGAYIYEFSIGMGPALYKHKRKNDPTEYCIRLFPIGGFVSIAGEDDETDKSIPREQQLFAKPWHNRFLTMIAGVMFNFLLAFVLLFIVGCIKGVPKCDTTVSGITPAYPLEATNISVGDKVVGFNSKKIRNSDELVLYLILNENKPATFTVKHKDGTKEKITVEPVKVEEEGEISYRFGLELSNEQTKSFPKLLAYPFVKTASLIEQMFLIIKYLILGKLSLNNLSGPVGIYTVVGDTAKAGFVYLLYLIAYLCINVGFINLIPLPAFDGGRALFLIIEKIRGKRVNPKIENTIHTIGFYLLLLLMVLITYNDIMRLIR